MGEAVAVVRLIREQLKEVVGRRIASAVAETRIQQLLQLYGEEEEGVRCVLHTLLEEVFNEEDQDGFVVFDREEIASALMVSSPPHQPSHRHVCRGRLGPQHRLCGEQILPAGPGS